MKTFLLFVSLVSYAWADTGVVHHPVPKKPIYVAESWYPNLKKQLPMPPAAGSAKQKSDETELFAYQKSRTEEDCAAARSEILVSLGSFFGTAGSPIPKPDLERLTPFFEQVRNDADFFIQKLKVDFPRKRPFLYMKGLEPCVAKEVTGAYPSGHAVLSELFSLVLKDLYPSHAEYLEKRAKEIADHRILVGMHHRTDIVAGQALAGLIYEEFKKSPRFLRDLKTAAKKQN